MGDLKGKTIAIPASPAVGELAVTAALSAEGVDPQAGDVTFVHAPFPNLDRLLTGKKADAIRAAEPFRPATGRQPGASCRSSSRP